MERIYTIPNFNKLRHSVVISDKNHPDTSFYWKFSDSD